jgi:hypothetical protein
LVVGSWYLGKPTEIGSWPLAKNRLLVIGIWYLGNPKSKANEDQKIRSWPLAVGCWLLATVKTKSNQDRLLAIGQGKNQNKTHHSGAGDD